MVWLYSPEQFLNFLIVIQFIMETQLYSVIPSLDILVVRKEMTLKTKV
jgi:hypothetical protein